MKPVRVYRTFEAINQGQIFLKSSSWYYIKGKKFTNLFKWSNLNLVYLKWPNFAKF